MTISSKDIDTISGAAVRGADDDKIGTVGQVYVDPAGEPVWVSVKTGFFGTAESFVPLQDASFDGESLQVTYSKDFVKDAPRIADDGELSEDETGRLYDYYNIGSGSTADDRVVDGTTTSDGAGYGTTTDSTTTDHAASDAGTTDATTDAAGYDASAGSTAGADDLASTGTDSATTGSDTSAGYDTSGPTTDNAMTRSEERLHVGTKQTETGRARLRKHIVTEQQTVTVPVSHEELTVTREPITDANAGSALAGGELTEEEHEVVLHADQVVTSKETVPVERIQLGTETITEQQQVTEDVRKEQVEVIDPTSTSGTQSSGYSDATGTTADAADTDAR